MTSICPPSSEAEASGRWSEMFTSAINEQQRQQQARLVAADAGWQQLQSAKKAAKWLKQKIAPPETVVQASQQQQKDHSSTSSGTYRILVRPPEPRAYAGPHNVLCDVCCKPVDNSSNNNSTRACGYCNYSAHTRCLSTPQSEQRGGSLLWHCPECIAGRQSDDAYFQVLKGRSFDALKQQQAALVLARFMTKAAKRVAYSKEQDRAVRIQKLLQLKLGGLQVCARVHL